MRSLLHTACENPAASFEDLSGWGFGVNGELVANDTEVDGECEYHCISCYPFDQHWLSVTVAEIHRVTEFQ